MPKRGQKSKPKTVLGQGHLESKAVKDDGHTAVSSVITDVTGVEELHESEQRLSSIIASITDCHYELDKDWRFILINDRSLTYFGRKRDEFIGKTYFEVFPTLMDSIFKEQFDEAVSKSTSVHFDVESILYPGRWIEFHAYPTEEGGLSVFFRDISELKQKEELIRKSEEKFRAIADYTYGWENWFDSTGKLVWVNPAVYRLTGYTVDECVAMTGYPLSLVDSEDRSRFAGCFAEAIKGSSGNDVTFRIRCKDGSVKWVAVSWQPIYDDKGTSLGHRSSIRDITDRKQAEEELGKVNKQLASILSHSVDATYQRNLETDSYDYMSPVIEQLTGFSAEEMMNLGINEVQELIHPDDLAQVNGEIKSTFNGEKEAGAIVYRFRRKTGEYTWLSDRFSLLRDSKGRPSYRVGIVRDVTERKQAEEKLARSETRYRELVQYANSAILRLKSDGAITFINEYGQALFGYSYKELLGKHVSILLPQVDSTGADLTQLVQDIVDHPERYVNNVNENICRDGSLVWMSWTNKPIFDEDGRVAEILAVGTDITDRKQAEEALRKSEMRLNEAQRIAHLGSWGWDFKTEGVYWSDETYRIFGVEKKDFGLTYQSFLACIHPDDRKAVDEALHMSVEDPQKTHDIEFRVVRPDGSERIVHGRGEVLFDADRKPVNMVGTVLDITERKQAEEALRRSNATQKGISAILQTTLTCETEEELGGTCLKVCEELTQSKFGFIGEITKDGLQDIAISDPGWQACKMTNTSGHCRPPGNFKIHGIYGRVLSDSKPLFTNDPAHHPDSIGLPSGHPPLRAFLGVPLIQEGRTLGMIAVGNRQGGYRKAEQDTLEALAPAIVEALLRKRSEEALRQAHEELELRVQERTKDLQNAYDSLQTATEERRKLEDQLRQSQKMEAIGTVAGGIAHDFNNILAAIMGFTGMVVEDMPKSSKETRYLRRVLKAAYRGRDLVKQILAFSQKTELTRAPVLVSPIIEETTQLLRASLPTTVEIVLDIRATSATVHASAIELQQVLMNLATNGSRAMGEKGGTLHIGLTDVDLKTEVPFIDSAMEPGAYMQLVVRDTGVGMSPGLMERIFEPYFTTRATGEGTGMGLAVVYGIVKSLNGTIAVESEPGVGSTFRVFLPKVRADAQSGPYSASEIPHGAERVLFVDDEDLIVELGKALLERLGYAVTALADSTKALDLFSSDPSAFDLVILDQTMPKLTGLRLAKEILKIQPGIPIILCTGHSDSVSPQKAKEAGIRAFLMKPLSNKELAEVIRKVLNPTESEG
jgi:PAS domain S-box-containing protein